MGVTLPQSLRQIFSVKTSHSIELSSLVADDDVSSWNSYGDISNLVNRIKSYRSYFSLAGFVYQAILHVKLIIGSLNNVAKGHICVLATLSTCTSPVTPVPSCISDSSTKLAYSQPHVFTHLRKTSVPDWLRAER